MKKVFMIISLGIVAISCAKENNVSEEPQQGIEKKGREVSFIVSVEGRSDTRSTISASDNFTWESTDRAAVYTNQNDTIHLKPTQITGDGATFVGTLKDDSDFIPEGAVVVYPAARLKGSKDTPAVEFPSQYDNPSKTQGPTLAAVVTSDKTLLFYYLAGTVKVSISDLPSIATSVKVNTVDPDNQTNPVICTGTYPLVVVENTPSLDSDNASNTGNQITINSPSSDHMYIPLPTEGSQRLYLDVMYNSTSIHYEQLTFTTVGEGDNVIKKNGGNVTRNMFASMPAISINPDVYLVSDFGGSEASTKLTSKTGTTYSSNSYNLLNPGVNGKTFRFNVVYTKQDPDITVQYGYSSTTDGSSGGTLSVGQTNKARLYKGGRYSVAFNYVDGTYTTTKSAGMYVIGTDNYWAFDNNNDNGQAMTSLAGGIYVWQGEPGNTGIKFYEAGLTSWTSGTYGSNGEGDGKTDISVTSDAATTLLFRNIGSEYWAANWSENSASTRTRKAYKIITGNSDCSSVKLLGVGGDWSTGITLTQLYGKHIWGKEGVSVASNSQVKFLIGSTYAGSYGSSDGSVDLSTFNMYGLQGGANGKNFSLPAGTYDIYFDDEDWYCYIVKK